MNVERKSAGTDLTQETESRLSTPLAEVHRAAGARMGTWFGCDLPDDFGDAREEQRYATQSVALTDKNYRAYLAFRGPDRVRYLNAILTNNIKGLENGQGVVSLLLNAQGRVLAEIETFAETGETEELFCVSYRTIRERLMEVLDKYIIMDDVTLKDETERFGTLGLEGPEAAKVVKELTGIELEAIPELGWARAEVKADSGDSAAADAGNKNLSAIPCRLVKRSAGNIPGAELVVERERLAALWSVLLLAAKRYGGGATGYQALSAQRLVQGTPWFGYDFGEKQIPHEAGLEMSHISYTKGCYTGQEIVERVRSRGQVNRRRVELLFSGDGEIVPQSGTELFAEGTGGDGKSVGYVTRAAKSWFPACILGMGYLGKEYRAPGTVLQWSGGSATVVEFKDALREKS